MLDNIIPYTTSEGHEYLIRFTEFNKNYLPKEFLLPIVDITIVANSDMTTINNGKTLAEFSSLIKNYLTQEDIVLYFYCSNDPIIKSSKRKNVSNSQYRSDLFCKMFEKQNLIENDFICENVLIEDPMNGDHHIHLISRVKNEIQVKLIIEKGLPYFENK